MSFVAVFDDGPCMDQRREWAVGDPHPDLYFTSMRAAADGSQRWTMVGFTGQEPVEPWPNQVHYVVVGEDPEEPPYRRRTIHYAVKEEG